MKTVLTILFSSAVCSSGAVTLAVCPETLAPGAFADTEAVTNVACASWTSGLRDFEVTMELTATPSNCVTVAFGRDADGDGVLSVTEAAFELGWDCGRWIVRSGPGASPKATGLGETGFAGVSCAPVTGGDRKTFRWKGIVRNRRAGDASATEDGRPLFAGVSWREAGWCYGADWNLARVAVRGADAAAERICLRQETVGIGIFVF